ncbi:hypothetical protein RHMOL_Rhmol02G0247700 [Rhododendron molle]|uniref:Uncharacterized protein n=1 Tax=Rhododendron molle TaxID=49168 RepID=A0ACC0PWX3_RHOML|nr:hypothetical protein RHMOL_Rhmol02G0247700 [Rhododendron molle]
MKSDSNSDSASAVSDGFGSSFSHGHGCSRDSGYRSRIFGHTFGERGNISCFVVYFIEIGGCWLVLAGSYFCVAGAIIGVLKPGRMSMFGTLLIIWGLVKEGFLGKPVNTDPAKTVFVYPTMLIALVCAFASVKYDVQKVARGAPARPIAKPLQSSSKSKLN